MKRLIFILSALLGVSWAAQSQQVASNPTADAGASQPVKREVKSADGALFVTYTIGDIRVRKNELDGQNYLELDGFQQNHEPGTPATLGRIDQIAVPYGCKARIVPGQNCITVSASQYVSKISFYDMNTNTVEVRHNYPCTYYTSNPNNVIVCVNCHNKRPVVWSGTGMAGLFNFAARGN